MKFQNPILNLKHTANARTDEPKAICPFNYFKVGGIKFVMDGQTDKPKAICPFNFFKVGA